MFGFIWSEWRDSNSRPLPPEGEEAVDLSSNSLVSLSLRSVEIATDRLKRCGIVAVSLRAQGRRTHLSVGTIGSSFRMISGSPQRTAENCLIGGQTTSTLGRPALSSTRVSGMEGRTVTQELIKNVRGSP
ncbi:MAG: hypothetical protein MRY77_18530, partial [Rhodobacteraceae bacterium]|nr:hypothetical protein [Paracoccaceae bacterium]